MPPESKDTQRRGSTRGQGVCEQGDHPFTRPSNRQALQLLQPPLRLQGARKIAVVCQGGRLRMVHHCLFTLRHHVELSNITEEALPDHIHERGDGSRVSHIDLREAALAP